MIKVEDYIAYFKNLADKHVNIQNGLNGETRFAAISMDQLLNNLINNVQFVPSDGADDKAVMLLEDISGQIRGVNFGNLNDEADGALTILKHCPTEDFEREHQIYNECKQICLDILGYMANDYANNENSSIMQYFEPQNGVRYDKVGPVMDNCFGMRVEFKFKSSINLFYDANKFLP